MIETDVLNAPFEVDDLDAETLLALASDSEIQTRVAERRKLRLAHQWCVLHPAGQGDVATWSDAGLKGTSDWDEPLGGEGSPKVAAFTAEPFAAALGLTPYAGMLLLADALDLRHRLPLIWAQVEALQLQAWKARQVAQATRQLSREAAAFVDGRLASRKQGFGAPTVAKQVAEAIARFHPDLLEEQQRTGKRAWRVRLHRPRAGSSVETSHLEATGSSLDLQRFYDLVCAEAAELGKQGDEDPLDVRKAKALGVIADRLTGASATGSTTPSRSRSTLYIHTSLTELLHHLNTGEPTVADVEGLGPATLTLVAEWLQQTGVTVRPVLDLDRSDAVDQHDPPAWMREQVIVRDLHCVFPGCRRPSRACDLDHIEAYDPHGPPGQTNPENLAPLCRRHHRCKTVGRWRYVRDPSGSYRWTTPHHHSWLVTASGTFPQHAA